MRVIMTSTLFQTYSQTKKNYLQACYLTIRLRARDFYVVIVDEGENQLYTNA